MTNHTQWMQETLKMVRLSLEVGINNMETFQTQAQKAIELALNNASVAQDQATKALQDWNDNVTKARKVYTDAIEEGLNVLDQMYSPK